MTMESPSHVYRLRGLTCRRWEFTTPAWWDGDRYGAASIFQGSEELGRLADLCGASWCFESHIFWQVITYVITYDLWMKPRYNMILKWIVPILLLIPLPKDRTSWLQSWMVHQGRILLDIADVDGITGYSFEIHWKLLEQTMFSMQGVSFTHSYLDNHCFSWAILSPL